MDWNCSCFLAGFDQEFWLQSQRICYNLQRNLWWYKSHRASYPSLSCTWSKFMLECPRFPCLTKLPFLSCNRALASKSLSRKHVALLFYFLRRRSKRNKPLSDSSHGRHRCLSGEYCCQCTWMVELLSKAVSWWPCGGMAYFSVCWLQRIK